MILGSCIVTLRAEWVHSLKEKRMVLKSIIEKAKNKFNISIAEVDSQDMHQELVIGFCCVSNETAHADSILDHVISFIENNTDAEVTKVEKEII